MNECLKNFRAIASDVTVTSQSRYFCAIFNNYAEMVRFCMGFSSVDIELGLGQIIVYFFG